MSEFVETCLEALLPIFEQLRLLSLFNEKELNAFAKQCRRHEYRLQKLEKQERDFIHYAEYLNDILRLIKIRRQSLSINDKVSQIERPLKKKIVVVMRRACDRWKNNMELWESFFGYARRFKLRGYLSKAFTSALSFHGQNVNLRCAAAKFEAIENSSAANARAILQMGIRQNPQEPAFFQMLFYVELRYVVKLTERLNYLKNKKKGVVVEGDAETDMIEEAQADAITRFDVASFVLEEALRSVPSIHKTEMLLTMYDECCVKKMNICAEIGVIRAKVEEAIEREGELSKILLSIRKQQQQGIDPYDAYDLALRENPSEDMIRAYMKFCDKRTEMLDRAACAKKDNLFALLIKNKQATNDELLNFIEARPEEVEISVVEDLLKTNPCMCMLWMLKLQDAIAKNEESSGILEMFDDAFGKVASSNSLPLWNLAVEYALKACPKKVEKLFSRTLSIEDENVRSQMKTMRFDYLNCLVVEKKLTPKAYESEVDKLIKNKPNSASFYISVAEKSSCPKLAKSVWQQATNEHGATNVDVWIGYLRYLMAHDAAQVSKTYQRAMLCLSESSCAEFVEEWTRLLQSSTKGVKAKK